MRILRLPHHNHVFQMLRLNKGRARFEKQGFGDDCDLRAGVVEEKTVVGRTHEGVHGHRHRSQLHRAEEGGDELRAIQENQEDPVLHLNAEIAEGVADTVHGFEDFPIGDDAVFVVQGRSACAAFHHVTIDEEGRCVEPIGNRGGWLSHDRYGGEWEQGRKKIAEAETGRIHRGRPRFSGRIRRKPEHVGPTPHGARASTGRVIRRGRKEAPILPNVEYEEARSNGWDFVTKKTGIADINAVLERFAGQQYIADPSIGMAVYLSVRMGKPLLVEGEPGCGKTEIARTLAAALGTELIRLQCYEGLDADATLYEWNHPKQLIPIRIEEARKDPKALEREIFNEEILLKRPLLQALTHGGPQAPVLLIDEIDRADEEFEGLLLEFLSDFQITIPEMGTIRAKRVPHVVITSNRTRELSDALKRRCLYLYIGYPSREKEVAILRAKVPGLGDQFAEEIAVFVQLVRAEE